MVAYFGRGVKAPPRERNALDCLCVALSGVEVMWLCNASNVFVLWVGGGGELLPLPWVEGLPHRKTPKNPKMFF